MHMREAVARGGGTYSDTMHVGLTIVLSLLFLLAFGAVAFRTWFRLYSVATILTLVAFGTMASMQAAPSPRTSPRRGRECMSASTSRLTCCG